ncbi:MAG: spermidine/putrescine ABC transporter substrate-binding protein [Clostridia bacterium]|nr:spermidine/putrescine ABC transporter substrate-binding protein [Clostridia bacterium]
MKRLLTLLSALVLTAAFLISVGVPAIAEAAESQKGKDKEPVYSLSDYPINEAYYRSNPYRGTTLNVYNWGEYIADGSDGMRDVNKEFEALTGIQINYTNFDSNEDMYAKIKGGGANYDICVPSDYMIERMKDEGMLLPINFDNIPNYKYIMDQYKGLYYDPDNAYSVPYNVGYVALVYNTKLVDEVPDSWEILWNPKYAGQVLMFNNPRDGFALAQSALGLDYNSTDPEDWARAYDKLLQQKPVVRSYVMDEVFNIMESGSAALAPYYAGDCLTMMDNNPDLAVVYPKEGANIFVDAFCIPETAQNQGAAELYINFMMEPEICLANAEYLCYGTPHEIVRYLDEYSLRDSEEVYPDESVFEHYQYFHNLPSDTQTLMSNYWSDLKIDGSSNRSVYVGLAVFAGLAAAAAVYAFARKKHREKYYD